MTRLFAAFSAIFLWYAAAGHAATPADTGTTPPAQQQIDSVARLLAGLPPGAAHAELASTKAWIAHREAMQKSWLRVRDGQLAAMQTWRSTQLPKDCPVGNTLFYPFSGPDFLNANVLFPGCDNYVLFGLEPVGEMPNPGAMTAPEYAKLLTSVRDAMINLFSRNYFVTSRMKLNLQKTQLKGVLPVLTMSMVLAGAEVTAIGAAPFPSTTGKKHNLDGVAIDYRMPGSPRPKRLIYYTLDASDKGLADYPEFLTYLRQLEPTTTLIKSASYLLHITEFRKMRNVLLDTSAFLVQDDSGLQYDLLRKRGWEVRPYGTYTVPIPPFEKKFQPELAALFESGKAQPLPFRFGYHLNLNDTRSTLMVARRPPTAPAKKPDVR